MTLSIQKCFVTIFAAFVMLIALPVESAGKRSQTKQFKAAQSTYVSSIRWNEFEMAWSFVDPDYRKANPLTDLQLERFKQIQVTGYEEKLQELLDDGSIQIKSEIRLINRNTQTERSITNIEVWRWNAKSKRWWLMTGLPDFWARSY